MDQVAGKHTATLSLRSRKQLLRGMLALLVVCLLGGALAAAVRRSRIQHQMQTDPQVATVWLIQVTHGPNHTFTRGSTVQRWANEHGIHALGDYQVLNSSFNGEPNGLELWFNYESHTSVNQLECHRVGPTAFTDDLGQVYHGFLDFQGKTVGVYLPGYDHAAHRITAVLHWMPRRPAAPFPVSRPMTFTVPLPAARRTMPPAAALPAGPVSVTKGAITVTLSDVRLSPPRLRGLYEGQRDLTFQLHIAGGQMADENVAQPVENTLIFSGRVFPTNTALLQRQLRSAQGQVYTYRVQSGGALTPLVGSGMSPTDSFTISDPYSTPLIPGTASVSMPALKPAKGQKKIPFWVAPVTGAGRGTDAVLFHFHVQPPSAAPTAMPPATVAFDIPIRVSPDPAP